MAKDVVDAAVENFPRPVPPSVTGELPLIGADGLPAVRASAQRLADDYGLPVASVEHLVARYGATAVEVLELVKADKALGVALLEGRSYLRAEVAYAVTHEGALHVTDVLARRGRPLIESADSGASVAPEVAAIMAPLLGWSRAAGRPRSASTRPSPPPTRPLCAPRPRSGTRPPRSGHRRPPLAPDVKAEPAPASCARPGRHQILPLKPEW